MTQPSSRTDIVRVHDAVPGRLRLRVAGLKGDPARAETLRTALARYAAIRGVEARVQTGSLILQFDPAVSPEVIEREVREALRPRAKKGPAKPRAPQRSRAKIAAAARRKPAAKVLAEAPAAANDDADAPWHTLNAEQVAERLKVDPALGLDAGEIILRRETHGRNVIAERAPRSQLALFADQFTTMPVAMLAGSAVVSAATGGLLDAAITMAVVGINGVIGFMTEGQAERTIRLLTAPESHGARVRRAGSETEIGADEVVPGEVLLLKPGAFVAADARVTAAERLSVDESALTGESLPVEKTRAALATRILPLADRRNMVFMGTAVTGGSGEAIVVATGSDTEIGRIQGLAEEAERPVTPVERDLDRLGRQLVYACGAICAGVFAVGLMRGYPPLAMAKNAIALAVAAVPEGLPAIATTTLALGLHAMKDRDVLIRRLDAVEALGALDVVCFDKTGTLTENRMAADAVVTPAGRTAAIDAGQRRASDPSLAALLETVALCSEAAIEDADDGTRLYRGSGTETALVRMAEAAGLDARALRTARPVRTTIYRDETRHYMATLHPLPDGRIEVHVKGSPEQVVQLCDRLYADGSLLDDAARRDLLSGNETLADEGMRVLACARGIAAPGAANPLEGLAWLGLTGLSDPVRPGLKDLMTDFHRAGIRTVMITGDQSATAGAVARTLGLSDGAPLEILDSTHLDTIAPELLSALAARTHVFARVSPAHKLAIVKALQRSGLVVGMTGDGINDGPALKAADLGIAMGRSGTDVARETANIVLADDELTSLRDGVAQGRAIYANIRKSLQFLLATNLSEILVTLVEAIHGPGELETPMELLWINLVTDVLPGIGLAMLPPEEGLMHEPPRAPDAAILETRDLEVLGAEAAVISASVLGAHFWGLARYGAGPQTRAVTFMSLTLAQLFYSMTCRADPARPERAPGLFEHRPLIATVGASLALQALPAFVPAVQRILGIAPLRGADWPVVLGSAAIPFVLNEGLRIWRVARRRGGEEANV